MKARIWANLQPADEQWVRERAIALNCRPAEVIEEMVRYCRARGLTMQPEHEPTLPGFAQWLNKQRDTYKIDCVGPDRKVKPGGVSLFGLLDAYLKTLRA